jgi:hypothetical protein
MNAVAGVGAGFKPAPTVTGIGTRYAVAAYTEES